MRAALRSKALRVGAGGWVCFRADLSAFAADLVAVDAGSLVTLPVRLIVAGGDVVHRPAA